MPLVIRELGLLLPMTYYINIVSGIALKDVELLDVWQPAVILTGFALLLVTISVKRFSKTME
jgi:ABC-2 type transport system permease protein